MQLSDKKDFIAILRNAKTLLAWEKDKDFEEVAELMFQVLQKYDIDDIRNAILACIENGKFFPKVCDIKNEIEGTAIERATQAWRVFLATLDRLGYYDSVRFPDPAYHYAIEAMGGWMYLTESMTDKNMPFKQKDFEKAYILGEKIASWQYEPGKTRVLPYMRGFYEIDNRGKANGILPPIKDALTGRSVSDNMLQLGDGGSGGNLAMLAESLAKGMNAKNDK